MAYQKNNDQQRESSQAVATVERLAPMRLPVAPALLEKLDISEGAMRVLQDQIWPTAKSVDAIALALNYCRSRNLDPMKKPVHIVPVYSSVLRRMVETVWPGIAEIRTTATRTGRYAGLDEAEFGPTITEKFIQNIEDERDPRNNRQVTYEVKFPEWCKMTAYAFVMGQRVAFTSRVFWRECYATMGRNTDTPNEMWRKRPFGQLEKCTEAAVLRRAFPEELGGVYAAEEMHGKVIEGELAPGTYADPKPRQRPSAPPPADTPADASQPRQDDDKIIDAESEEIHDDEPDPWNGDDNAYFEDMRDRMAEARSPQSISELWEQFAPEKRFADKPTDLSIVTKIRDRRLREMEGAA